MKDAESAPQKWRTFALSYTAATGDDRSRLVESMSAELPKISDRKIRTKFAEVLDSLSDGPNGL